MKFDITEGSHKVVQGRISSLFKALLGMLVETLVLQTVPILSFRMSGR